MPAKTKSWKHVTKNRKPYMIKGHIDFVDMWGDLQWIKFDRRNGKRNTPFMQEDLVLAEEPEGGAA